MRKGENYTQLAKRIAHMLRERLSEEEFRDLLDLMGDYTTEEWFHKALLGVPVKIAAAHAPTPKTVWERLRSWDL